MPSVDDILILSATVTLLTPAKVRIFGENRLHIGNVILETENIAFDPMEEMPPMECFRQGHPACIWDHRLTALRFTRRPVRDTDSPSDRRRCGNAGRPCFTKVTGYRHPWKSAQTAADPPRGLPDCGRSMPPRAHPCNRSLNFYHYCEAASDYRSLRNNCRDRPAICQYNILRQRTLWRMDF